MNSGESMKNNAPATTPETLREWNSANDICNFLNVSRSFFKAHVKGRLKEYKWSSHLIRYNKADVLRFSEELRGGALNYSK